MSFIVKCIIFPEIIEGVVSLNITWFLTLKACV